ERADEAHEPLELAPREEHLAARGLRVRVAERHVAGAEVEVRAELAGVCERRAGSLDVAGAGPARRLDALAPRTVTAGAVGRVEAGAGGRADDPVRRR